MISRIFKEQTLYDINALNKLNDFLSSIFSIFTTIFGRPSNIAHLVFLRSNIVNFCKQHYYDPFEFVLFYCLDWIIESFVNIFSFLKFRKFVGKITELMFQSRNYLKLENALINIEHVCGICGSSSPTNIVKGNNCNHIYCFYCGSTEIKLNGILNCKLSS